MKLYLIVVVLVLTSPALFAQSADETVRLEIVNADGAMKEYKFKLPFGPPPTGDSSAVFKKVEAILTQNDIDCPPKREKVSDKIWKCGNGKLIRTPDARLERLLTKAWDK